MTQLGCVLGYCTLPERQEILLACAWLVAFAVVKSMVQVDMEVLVCMQAL